MRVIHKNDFRTCLIEPVGPVPDYPKMRGNDLFPVDPHAKVGSVVEWFFEAVVIFPSGKLQWFRMTLPPSTRDAAIEELRTLKFWTELWETLIIVMSGQGEGPQGQKVAIH